MTILVKTLLVKTLLVKTLLVKTLLVKTLIITLLKSHITVYYSKLHLHVRFQAAEKRTTFQGIDHQVSMSFN
jgi:hypothetical protein